MKTSLQLEQLEAKLAPAAWVVIPPGVGSAVVEQTIPDAAIEGLQNAARHANAGAAQGATCWLVRFDTPPTDS